MFHRVKSETNNPSEENETPMTKTSRPYDAASEGFSGADNTPQQQPARPSASREQASSAQEQQPSERAAPPAREYTPEPAAAASSPKSPGSFGGGSAFTRGSQPAAPRSSAGYGTAYPGAGYKIPTPIGTSQSTEKDRTLTIGAGITMSGEIESCDYLLVEGTVEAALKGARTLEIAESGTFYGTVEIGEATIAGRFEGDITVHGRLTVTATGSITGSIAYKELEVEAGAVIDGRITQVSNAQAFEGTDSSERTKSAKTSAPANKARGPKATERGETQQPANAGGSLFSASAAAE